MFLLWVYLHVDVGAVINKHLEAECAAGGGGSQMHGRVALVVGLVDVGAAVHQLRGGRVLPRVAGQVQRRVPRHVGFISLVDQTSQTWNATKIWVFFPPR